MMRLIVLTRERALFYAMAYMTALVGVVGVFWYLLLVGGIPFTARSVVTVNAQGIVDWRFSRGDLVGVRRVLCSERNVDARFLMSIKSDLGLVVPLFGVVTHVREGCHQYGYGFIMPPLPTGVYNITSTVMFQTNLVGRDEYSEFEPLPLEVLP